MIGEPRSIHAKVDLAECGAAIQTVRGIVLVGQTKQPRVGHEVANALLRLWCPGRITRLEPERADPISHTLQSHAFFEISPPWLRRIRRIV